jgi:hypothetical protein
MTTIKEHTERMADYSPDTAIAVHVLHVDDVLHAAEGMSRRRKMHIAISPAEAEDILHGIHNRVDATIGINWDVIEVNIDMHIDERSKEVTA